MTAEFPLAVHALVYLDHTGRVTTSTELADNICTNPARVRKVMAKLCRAGLAAAQQGKGSGYVARGNAETISLAQILSALGETPAGVSWRPGDMKRDCQVSSGMADVMDRVYGRMNETCMRELAAINVGSVNHVIFGKEVKE